MVDTSFIKLLSKSIMISIGERRSIFLEEKRKALSEMLSHGIGPGSGVIADMVGELCIKEIPIRTNIIIQTIERIVFESGVKPFPGISEIIKKEALRYIPLDLGEFRSIIDRLPVKMIKSDYFAPQFLSARLNTLNKINTEIDLLVLRLQSSLNDKRFAIESQTIYNISSQGGIVQTGDGSTANIIIFEQGKQELLNALDIVLKAITDGSEFNGHIKDETKDIIEETKFEVEKQKPNGIKVTSLLFGLATTVQSIASMKPAYEALKTAASAIGIYLP
jgi:hypothetical protein